ncbi:MAG: hypothetical protein ACJ798_06540, partial [Phenylobacterium sp.]
SPLSADQIDSLSNRKGYSQIAFTPQPVAGLPTSQLELEATRQTLLDTAAYYLHMSEFLYTLGINRAPPQDQSDADRMVGRMIQYSQDIVLMWGGWLLPAIYALLGSVVFQLRAIMSPIVPTPNLGAVIVRSALAMMAGVSISLLEGSFSGRGLGGHGPGLTVFGVAFLFGFSLDVFFSALDRVVASVSKSILART